VLDLHARPSPATSPAVAEPHFKQFEPSRPAVPVLLVAFFR